MLGAVYIIVLLSVLSVHACRLGQGGVRPASMGWWLKFALAALGNGLLSFFALLTDDPTIPFMRVLAFSAGGAVGASLLFLGGGALGWGVGRLSALYSSSKSDTRPNIDGPPKEKLRKSLDS